MARLQTPDGRPGRDVPARELDWDHGDVAEAWYRMGEPLDLTRDQEARLRATADDLLRRELTVSDDGVLEIDLELPPWAVVSLSRAR
ncbi:hypothetical protein [Cellulomonas fimi]|uniref:hypothetical protein n=1 Tax=Cellulomonas fimi TaxID=1708 RepID=UPI0005A22549|nr:hypothetical protein [Cellulomonas fimi]VEH35660.1 Uncharacterised protein [Cellulomonas fimi]